MRQRFPFQEGATPSCRHLEIGCPRNFPKAVEGHCAPKTPSFESHDPIDLERGSPLPLFPQHPMRRR